MGECWAEGTATFMILEISAPVPVDFVESKPEDPEMWTGRSLKKLHSLLRS